jgi:hypothetical protein
MVSSQVRAQFIKAGVYLLPRDLGVRMLNREIIAQDRAPEVVIFGAEDIEKRLPVVRLPRPPVDFKQPPSVVQSVQGGSTSRIGYNNGR